LAPNAVAADPYEDGRAAYFRKDYSIALGFWRPLAEQGNVGAQFYLGVLYERGQGVPKDYVEGAKWYQRSAEQGDADSQYRLGGLYEAGYGVPQDYVQAHKWYNLAASKFSAHFTSRDTAIRARNEITYRMTREQIAEAQRLAREWKPKPER